MGPTGGRQLPASGEWAGLTVHFGLVAHSASANERINLPSPDYEADDVLVVREPEQLKALGDDPRSKIVILLRDRASSTTELAAVLGLPKGTVGHHVKVTREGRARPGRAAEEMLPIGSDAQTTFGVDRARLSDADARRLVRRLEKLIDDFRAADGAEGDEYGLAAAFYRRAVNA